MAEAKQEKKKHGIVKRIFKWIGLGLLVALIIGALVYDAPWKVLALLLVLLAAHTILPKAAIKWFWLAVVAVAVVLVIWVFLPEETKGWRPYTFDKELAELRAKYAVPDSENAAIIYNQLLEDYNKAALEPNFVDPNLKYLIREEFWLSKDHPEAAEWLKRQEGTVAKLIEASKIEQCRFPINAEIGSVSGIMNRLSMMKRLAGLLISAANNDMAEGRTNKALEKYIASLQIGKHQRQQPSMIDFMVGVGIEAPSYGNLKRFIVEGDATEEHLDLIESTLADIKHDWSTDWPRILDYEKLLAKNFCGRFYGISPEGKIRLKPSVTTRVMMAQLPEDVKDEFVITYWYKRLMKASTIWAWFYMPSTPQKAGEIIDTEYKKLYAMAEPDFNWRKGVGKPAKMLRFSYINYRYVVVPTTEVVPVYDGAHDIYLRHISQQKGVLLTIVLRRYKNKTGHWPESLDEVKSLAAEEIFVDPLNEDSFVYKLTDGNFELYSKGKNNIDEDGQYNSTCDPNSGECKIKEDDWPIWLTRGAKRKAEKENTDAKQH